MINFVFSLFVAVCATLFVGCDNPATEQPQPPVDEKVSFKVTVTETTRTTMTFSVEPSDLDSDYVVVVYDVPYVDDFTKDDYLVATIYEELAHQAAKTGLTFDEFMADNVDRGIVTDGTFSGLAVDTEYYILTFAVDATNGYALCSDVNKTRFRTAEAPTMECTFDVATSVYLNTVTLNVVPSDKSLRWHLMTMPKAMFNEYTDPEGDMRMSKSIFYQQYFQNEINQLLSSGYTEQQVIDALMLQGDQQLSAKGLNANSEYVYLVAGIVMDTDGLFIATPITEGTYTSGEAAQSDMTFNIEVWDIETLYVSVRITPSNDNDMYCALIQPWDGHSTAVEVMDALIAQWGSWMQLMANDKGMVEHSGNNKFKLDAPDTDYYVIAFGYEGGVTTAPEMVTFRSLPSDIGPEKATFNMTAGGVTPYGFTLSITTDDDTVFYTAGAMAPEEWNEEELVAVFNENFDYVYEQSKAFDSMITIPQVVRTYYWNGNQTLDASGLTPDTEVMGYLMAIDSKTGHVAKVHTFPSLARTAHLGTITPAVELVGHYSGDDEAGALFGDASATAGRAVTVAHYTDFGGATSLFSTILTGDYESEMTMSDSQLWMECSSYWTKIKLTQPYSFFVTEWETDYTVVAYAADENNTAGALGRLYTRATAQNKGDIADLKALVDELNAKTRCNLSASLIYREGADIMSVAQVTSRPRTIEPSGCLPDLEPGLLLQLDAPCRIQHRVK